MPTTPTAPNVANAAGASFNPAKVMMKSDGSSSAYMQPSQVRATGSGPFDPAYRQNLATYAMGQFTPQSGGSSTNFNPTGPIPFGQASGGGNAPVQGLPMTLLGQAMGGQPGMANTSGPTPP